MADEKLAWAFSFASIGEGQLDLAAFKANVLLVTNTASSTRISTKD
jgi:glutathione peroxidase-family protein